MVPTLPRGLFVTTEMQSVLDAVLSDTSTPQIGFCGMGGIGKTTVSCWVTRDDAVRTKFGMVAWITLGQTPVLATCMDLLHMQLAGSPFPDSVAIEQKHEILQQAFLNKSVLLVLDDCWDATVIKHFNWIDQGTGSKILISSRVRDVLDGGQIIDVTVPSKSDAVKMLLNTAEMDVEALKERVEVAHVAELCKRLPLTIGVAGKLIRQLAHGSDMSEASEWSDVVALLEEELNDPDGSMSIEESVIRASIKAIPQKMRKNVLQLFLGFALVPEDTFVPLSVLGMVFHACAADAHGKPSTPTKPLSRMQVRRYLKVLIDRSLVLGTVDRPQLHDVMLDYVQKQLTGNTYKAAQRQLVESLRNSDRSAATVTGKYIQRYVRHHINESRDPAWETGDQAIAWLEDHVNGVQDVISISTASVLPTLEALAKEAELAENWWSAALRWNAIGWLKTGETGAIVAGNPFFKLAVNASSKAVAFTPDSSRRRASVINELTPFDLDSFDLHGINSIMKSFNPVDIATYGPRMQEVLAAKAGRSRPLMCYAAHQAFVWFPGMMSGNEQTAADANWKMSKTILDTCDENSNVYALSTEEERSNLKCMLSWTLRVGGDALLNSPGFSWNLFGPNGDVLVEHHNAYRYDEHHRVVVELISTDAVAFGGTPWLLTLQYGRVEEVLSMLDVNLLHLQRMAEFPASAGYALGVFFSAASLPPLHHIVGSPKHVQSLYAILGITFDNAEERMDTVTKSSQGVYFTTMERKEPGGGFFSLKRIIWQIKAQCILDLDVPKPQATAWLESLPDNEAFYAYSMTLPHEDYGTFMGMYQACWIALAHEKVGLCEGALRFADLQLETDILKAGTPLKKWPQVIAYACKGRVLAKLDRHDEALVAFQAAIAVSKESYSLMVLLALRELANYTDGGGDAAVQAAKDLALKLGTFKGRMTREEFAGLTIAP